MEIILCAATWYEDLEPLVDRIPPSMYLPKNINKGLVFCGHRHHQCLLLKSAMTGKKDAECEMFTQGFLTNKNRFVNRKEAYDIAYKADQIVGPNSNRANNDIELTSEDLY